MSRDGDTRTAPGPSLARFHTPATVAGVPCLPTEKEAGHPVHVINFCDAISEIAIVLYFIRHLIGATVAFCHQTGERGRSFGHETSCMNSHYAS